jgi:hypothetical protein
VDWRNDRGFSHPNFQVEERGWACLLGSDDVKKGFIACNVCTVESLQAGRQNHSYSFPPRAKSLFIHRDLFGDKV